MQFLSAYLLETPPLGDSELEIRTDRVNSEVSQWLRTDKEVSDPSAKAGNFESKTRDGSGSFAREHLELPIGTLDEIRLEEFTRAGQIFTTNIALVRHAARLRVYCTLNVANAESVVAPLPVDPRCPSIVRTLLEHFNDWQLSGSPLPQPKPKHLLGDEGGYLLAEEIRKKGRPLPIVVVSEIEGEQLWPDLAGRLAFDLAGLAEVVTVDVDATWALSDELGKLHSCYRGAVRLYWPPRVRDDGEVHFNSTVWTASTLLSNCQDPPVYIQRA